MGYFETTTFGGGGIPLKKKTAAKDYFIGTEYGPSGRTQNSATLAKGIDYGESFGSYRHRLQVCIYCVQPVTFTSAGGHPASDLEVELYESADNTTFTPNGKFTIPVESLNNSDNTPIMFTPISINKRYMCVRFKFVGNSSTTSDIVDTGNILVSLEPTTF